MMIDDVIYGVILNAKIDICSNEPPVNALKKLNASLDWLANRFLKKVPVYARNWQLRANPDNNQH